MHIAWQYLVIEALLYLAALVVFRHARRAGPRRLGELAAGMVFGVLLEIMTIWQSAAYHYGRFAIMIAGVPLVVGVGWGLILYSAMQTSDRLGLPVPARPALDMLLALSIDLIMDPVATRLGMWQYPPSNGWFGVPYGNFFGWLSAVGSFSCWLRFVRWQADQRLTHGQATRTATSALVPFLAFPPALLSLGALNYALLGYLAQGYPGGVLVWSVALSCAALVVWSTRHASFDQQIDGIVIIPPFLFQSYFAVLAFVQGYPADVPGLGLALVALWIVGQTLFLAPSWRRIRFVGWKGLPHA